MLIFRIVWDILFTYCSLFSFHSCRHDVLKTYSISEPIRILVAQQQAFWVEDCWVKLTKFLVFSSGIFAWKHIAKISVHYFVAIIVNEVTEKKKKFCCFVSCRRLKSKHWKGLYHFNMYISLFWCKQCLREVERVKKKNYSQKYD